MIERQLTLSVEAEAIKYIEMDDATLQRCAAEAFARLATHDRDKLILSDWIALGAALKRGQEHCKKHGISYPEWCKKQGYDYEKLGSKGKGLIYSAPIIATNDDILRKVHHKHPNMNNPEHILYEYKKIIKEERAQQIADERKKMAQSALTLPPSDRYRVFQDSIESWQPDKRYDWIITDPPYPKEYLPLFGVLADRAKEFLAPGGLMVVMSGQMYLPQVMSYFAGSYYWLGAYLTPGQPTPLRQINTNTTWKPLIFCSPNGDYKGKIFGDVFRSEANDKAHHKWGQSESGMYDIIRKLCLPGESILDPFMGAGTTGVAAIRHGCLFDGVEPLEENCSISLVRMYDEGVKKDDAQM